MMNIISCTAGERKIEQREIHKQEAYENTKQTEKKDTYQFESCYANDGRGFKNINAAIANKLSYKYDITNLSRREYGNLLKELRDSGVISDQEFSIAYAGSFSGGAALSNNAEGWPTWPMGETKCDFLQLFEQCVQLCGQLTKNTANMRIQSEIDTYSHLRSVFDRIQKPSNKDVSQEINVSVESKSQNEPKTGEQKKIAELAEKLRQDKTFMTGETRCYLHHPDGEKLAVLIASNDDGLLAGIAKSLSVSLSQAKNMLLSSDKDVRIPPLMALYGVLAKKARTEGLSQEETLLDGNIERMNLVWQGTFDQRMQPVKDAIDSALKEAGIELDQMKSFEFHLDTSSFHFSVTGGNEEENALIEQVVNEHCGTAVSALYQHRREDGKYNAWIAEQMIPGERAEITKKYDIASASSAYEKKMKNLMLAYNASRVDNDLKKRYGIRIHDIQYVDNRGFVGKTDDAEDKIRAIRQEILKYFGDVYFSLLIDAAQMKWGHDKDIVEIVDGRTRVKNIDETGVAHPRGNGVPEELNFDTPVFDEAVFTFTNGSFQVSYM